MLSYDEMSEQGTEFLSSLEVWDGKSSFGLDSIRAVMDYMGNPQDKPKIFHIAGTNGKGSVSAMISSIVSETGGTVGVNISPHLTERRERFIVNGKPVSDKEIGRSAYEVKKAVEQTDVSLSYHEAITATAFCAFKDLDYSVIEVGLGGRLDSSNVVTKPVATVITSISNDHSHILGDTLEKIAFEKSGIAKKDTKLFCGLVTDSVLDVIKKNVDSKKASLIPFQGDYRIEDSTLITNDGLKVDLRSNLNGEFQVRNASLAARACLELEEIGAKECEAGLSKVSWPGRLEVIKGYEREILIDCCHNEEGVKQFVEFVKSYYGKPVDIVFGCLNKDAKKLIQILKETIVHWHIVEPDSPRATKVEYIADILSCDDISYTSWERNYEELIKEVTKPSNRPLVIAGSIFLVGQR